MVLALRRKATSTLDRGEWPLAGGKQTQIRSQEQPVRLRLTARSRHSDQVDLRFIQPNNPSAESFMAGKTAAQEAGDVQVLLVKQILRP